MTGDKGRSDSFLAFPENFLWGSAVSGHQIEGSNKHSDWWHWELATEGQPESGVAIDYWNRFEEDHELLAEMGHEAFRIGIEWARIEPRKGEFNEEAVDHYRKMLESLRSKGIKICLTLHHWVLPKWVAEQDDWLNPDTVDQFLLYVSYIVDELGGYPDLWITLNEPMVALLAGNISGDFPPQRRSYPAYRKAARHMLRAHAGAYQVIHSRDSSARVGVAMAYPYFETWGTSGFGGWFERRALAFACSFIYQSWDRSVKTGRLHPFFGGGMIDGLKDSIDFCGVNYYFRLSLRFSLRQWKSGFLEISNIPEDVETTDLDWQIWPEGLSKILEEVWNCFRKPIFITENGLSNADDQKRPDYIKRHLEEIHASIKSGIPVEGYFHWSFIDNFEWKEGYEQCFGLVEVDFTEGGLKRIPRPSAEIYSRIIRENGFDS